MHWGKMLRVAGNLKDSLFNFFPHKTFFASAVHDGTQIFTEIVQNLNQISDIDSLREI